MALAVSCTSFLVAVLTPYTPFKARETVLAERFKALAIALMPPSWIVDLSIASFAPTIGLESFNVFYLTG